MKKEHEHVRAHMPKYVRPSMNTPPSTRMTGSLQSTADGRPPFVDPMEKLKIWGGIKSCVHNPHFV